jgi:chaperone required for assembly of F1-ATPase
VLLDGRGIKTAGGRAQVLPSRALAEAMAAEWAGQGEELDLGAFFMRDLADYATDVVALDRAGVIKSLLAYAGTDTLCYRAEPDEPLRERQDEVWDPLLVAAERRWDVHFERVAGIMHRPQPAATLARMAAVLAAEGDFALAALTTLTSLAASLVIALAALRPDADAEALWEAANLEEDWQAELWGKDMEAEARRERRFEAFAAAMRFARLAAEEATPY